ncbi:hypothetical protein HZY83_00560 [Gemella sp. GH3]|uniref:YlxM family DNA-binding protein n=1 Tax=unclassified Gemella TaxID=2624949 RepID=UPI0015CFC83F|nr:MULTISPECIES: sigma factor-like helix-turn-helix DNA-binding protein [unclassified Gemella]MBF0713201.1 hypothetical protein [Gemella sp. GH3.1]NYS50153.1 hypothetical protein [Gemella sp. GH3]
MELDKIIKISQLYDFYGDLLSDKQSLYMKNYFFDDLSLAEISENYGISKQAISNNIKRTINELEQFEQKLNLIKISNERLFLLNEIKKINNDKDIDIFVEQLIKLED